MQQARLRTTLGISLALAVSATACDSRDKAMAREVGSIAGERKEKKELRKQEASHELREQLEPVLAKIYTLNRVPRILEADADIPGPYKYSVSAGVLSVVRFQKGMTKAEQVRAIFMGVAEADAWALRKDARRTYADLVQRVRVRFGEEQKQTILKAYASLRLLQFFNSEDAQATIDGLPAELRAPVQELLTEYTQNKQKVWQDWMAVKMYARRVVANDAPFRGVLREIKKELGKAEPEPLSWEDSSPGPFAAWAKAVKSKEGLLAKLTNLTELRDRVEYLDDTHTLWVVQGSPQMPKKAANLKIDKTDGFSVMREDLGAGHNELTIVFSRKLKGKKLKKAYFQSIIYAHLLHDFAMLSGAGNDWAQRDSENRLDTTTAIVPDEYDPLYARCGAAGAMDLMVRDSAEEFPILAGLSGVKNMQKLVERAHKCVIAGADGKVYIPVKDDDLDVQGPAPGSRRALEQMLVRFENLSDIDLALMEANRRTEEDDVIDAKEAELKALMAQD